MLLDFHQPAWRQVTSDLPKTGGVFKRVPEDFLVEEVPSYSPVGEGAHVWLWVEKRDVPAGAALGRLAKRFDVGQRQIGSAGSKDRFAVTRQWFSVPDETQTMDVEALTGEEFGEGMRVVEATRHGNKLRTGHLRGNRFEICLRDVGEAGLERARAIVEVLAARGLPNFYGRQRFSRDNAARAIGLLRGERRKRRMTPYVRRMIVSSLQSFLFNEVLARRMDRGDLHRVLDGDVLQVVASGGMFVSSDPADQARLDAGEVVPAGPMFGSKFKHAEGVALEFEEAVLSDANLCYDDFKFFRKLALGARRANLVSLADLSVEAEGPTDLRLKFTLPKGAYATLLLEEVMGSPEVGA